MGAGPASSGRHRREGSVDRRGFRKNWSSGGRRPVVGDADGVSDGAPRRDGGGVSRLCDGQVRDGNGNTVGGGVVRRYRIGGGGADRDGTGDGGLTRDPGTYGQNQSETGG